MIFLRDCTHSVCASITLARRWFSYGVDHTRLKSSNSLLNIPHAMEKDKRLIYSSIKVVTKESSFHEAPHLAYDTILIAFIC